MEEQDRSLLSKLISMNCIQCRAPQTPDFRGGCIRRLGPNDELPACFHNSEDGGWNRLSNKLIDMEDNGEILPDQVERIVGFVESQLGIK